MGSRRKSYSSLVMPTTTIDKNYDYIILILDLLPLLYWTTCGDKLPVYKMSNVSIFITDKYLYHLISAIVQMLAIRAAYVYYCNGSVQEWFLLRWEIRACSEGFLGCQMDRWWDSRSAGHTTGRSLRSRSNGGWVVMDLEDVSCGWNVIKLMKGSAKEHKVGRQFVLCGRPCQMWQSQN